MKPGINPRLDMMLKKDCPRCNGTGIRFFNIIKISDSNDGRDMSHLPKCKYCHGTGKIPYFKDPQFYY